MVSGIQSSIGSSAYTKTAQLNQSPQSVENFKKQMKNTVVEGTSQDDEASPAQKSPLKESLKANDAQAGGLTKAANDTQLETKNAETTLTVEQARGSLLDIAV